MKHIIGSILISVIVTSGGLWIYNQNFAPRFATIDMKAYVNQLRQDYLDGHLDKQAIDSQIRDLGEKIKHEYKNTVVLLKEVVVSGQIQNISP